MGGLGNQLFQIFTTISYAMTNKQKFIFINSDMAGNRKTYWKSFLQMLQNFTKTILPIQNATVIKEKDFSYNPLELPNTSNDYTVLNGYFQSYKYFQENFNTICKFIKLDQQKEILKGKLEANRFICDYENTISIHFRLGDYKKLPNHHPILKYTYYKNSLQYIFMNRNFDETVVPLSIVYFCEEEDNEEITKMIKSFQVDYPFTVFCKATDDLEDYEQMLLMSLCKYNIIANSTFSLWGAYFNTNVGKIVCYPDTWFGSMLSFNNVNDLFYDDWLKIQE